MLSFLDKQEGDRPIIGELFYLVNSPSKCILSTAY